MYVPTNLTKNFDILIFSEGLDTGDLLNLPRLKQAEEES
jgi:hypothetical protein